MTDYITLIVAAISLIVSVVTTYFSLFSKGKLSFPVVNFIGAQAYATSGTSGLNIINDRIVLPVTVAKNGNKARSIRFKAVVNKKTVFHNTLGFSYIKLASPTESMSLDDFQSISASFVVMPRSSTTEILGFTQTSILANVASEPLIIDLWYIEGVKVDSWKKAYRINWDRWPKVVESYSKGSFVSSTNTNFIEDYQEEYCSNLLAEN